MYFFLEPKRQSLRNEAKLLKFKHLQKKFFLCSNFNPLKLLERERYGRRQIGRKKIIEREEKTGGKTDRSSVTRLGNS